MLLRIRKSIKYINFILHFFCTDYACNHMQVFFSCKVELTTGTQGNSLIMEVTLRSIFNLLYFSKICSHCGIKSVSKSIKDAEPYV